MFSKVAFLTLGLFVAGVVSAESIRVTLLGSGSPNPSPDQFGPSTLVEAGDQKLIFDVGRGATIRLAQAEVTLSGVIVFLTHLHSDHLNGLSDLWTMGYMPPTLRQTPLEIYGPPGIVDLADGLQLAFKTDREDRARELAGLNFSTDGASFDANEVSREGVIFDRGGVKVSAISVEHGAGIAFAYRVDYGGRSVVISGDTVLSRNLIDKARGVDLIIHEVMAVDEKLLAGSVPIQGMMALHTPPEDAGIVFRDVDPKMAVYNHIIRIRASDEAIETATRKTYSGPLEVGKDLMTFVVDDEVSIMNR